MFGKNVWNVENKKHESEQIRMQKASDEIMRLGPEKARRQASRKANKKANTLHECLQITKQDRKTINYIDAANQETKQAKILNASKKQSKQTSCKNAPNH